MKIVIKSLICLAVFVFNCFISNIYTNSASPLVGADLAVKNLNGGNTEFITLQIFNDNSSMLIHALWFVYIFFVAIMFYSDIKKLIMKINKMSNSVLAVMALLLLTGCFKPYDTPEIVEIGTSQTAFVIQLDGDSENQSKLNSVGFLESKKVPYKRIAVPHRWVQTGRFSNDGCYIRVVKIICVERSPVTRVWQTDSNSKENNAIWIESADSVGFSMGWSCTSFIKEEDASTFLYTYPNGSLADVMDKEIRARIQQVSAQVAAKYKLDELRGKKNEMANEVREDITKFFSTRGITITTVAMVGGMTYENPKIQEAIDQTVITQQEKVNSKSMLDAQADKNLRIESEAKALAEAARTKAKGEADGALMKAKAEAEGFLAVSQAIAAANSNPQLVVLKQIEVEKTRAERWNGSYPSTVIGSGSNTWVGLGKTEPVKTELIKP